jgi:hypothetical protein
MNITFEIANKIVGNKGEVTSVAFKVLKQSDSGFYKSFGECIFSPDCKSKTFIPIEKVTNSLLVKWVKENVGKKGIAEIDQLLTNRIKKESTPKQTTKIKG